jgi:hypothetical protein
LDHASLYLFLTNPPYPFYTYINKGIIFEKWRLKIFWVIQEPIFDYFQPKCRLGTLKYDSGHSSVFLLYNLYDLKLKGSCLLLSQINIYSSLKTSAWRSGAGYFAGRGNQIKGEKLITQQLCALSARRNAL